MKVILIIMSVCLVCVCVIVGYKKPQNQEQQKQELQKIDLLKDIQIEKVVSSDSPEELVNAILSKDKMKIEELIALGAKINPLSLAIILDQKDKVEELLKEQKLNIKAKGPKELTETMSGVNYGRTGDNTVAVEHTDEISISNLYIAALYDRVEIAKLLLKYGADVNEGYVTEFVYMGTDVSGSNTDHITPLTEAACNGNKEMTQLLLENGANVNYEDLYGNSVLDCVKNKDIKKLLIKYGAQKGSHQSHMQEIL